MDITSAIRDLLRHMEWADALVWTAVLGSPAAAADEALRERLYHVHGTQRAFLELWRGVPADLRPDGFGDAAELARWARGYYEQLWADESILAADALREPVPEALVEASEAGLGPGAATPSVGDTVLQVVTHGVYHRGQINMRLRELGCETPLTEYFVWVWLGRPAPSWPDVAP